MPRKKKKRRNAAADNWSAASDRGEFWFEPAPPQGTEVLEDTYVNSDNVQASNAGAQKSSGNNEGSDTYVHPAEAELLRALDRAESTPGWSFVSLKKFRDEILPSEPFVPGAFQPTDVHWQNLLRSAIEKRFVLVGKVPNPKSPQFPVTTIRLNRVL